MDNSQIEQIILTGDFSQLQTAFDALVKEISETGAAMNGLNKHSQKYETLVKQMTTATQQFIDVSNAGGKDLKVMNGSLFEMEDAVKALNGEFARLSDEGLRKNMTPAFNKLKGQVKEIKQSVGDFSGNVGNYTQSYEKAMRNVQMSTAQVVRELPSLGMSAQTFFLAISNNLPILADAVSNLNNLTDANGNAVTGFAKFKRGMKGMMSGILSWQTAMIAAVTLLIAYGDEIANWARKVFTANDAAAEYKETLNDLNEALEEGVGAASNKMNMVWFAQAIATDPDVSVKKRDQAAKKLAKILKLEINDTNLAAIKNGEYSKSIDGVTKAIFSQEKAKIALKKAEEELAKVLQNEEAKTQWEDGKDLNAWQNKQSWLGNLMHNRGASQAGVNMTSGDEGDERFRAKKIKEAEDEVERLTHKVATLWEEAKKYDLSDFFGDEENSDGSGSAKQWTSFWETVIRLNEAGLDTVSAQDWKFTKEGMEIYGHWYDELFEHYKDDGKEYASVLASKIRHTEEFQKRLEELRGELDEYSVHSRKDITGPEGERIIGIDRSEFKKAETEYKKELIKLENWKVDYTMRMANLGFSGNEIESKIEEQFQKRLRRLNDKFKSQYQPEAEFAQKRNAYLETTLSLTQELSKEKVMELERDERLAEIEKERATALQALKDRGVAPLEGQSVNEAMALAENDLNTVFDEKAKTEWSKFFLDSLEIALANIRQVTNENVNMASAIGVKPFQSYYKTHKDRVSSIGAQKDAYSQGMDEQIEAVDKQLLNRKQLTADAIVALEEKKNNLIKEKDKQLAEFQQNLEQENLDFKVESTREITDSVIDSMNSIASIFGSIGDMMGDNEEAQQKWYIAQTVMGTAAGMAAAIASPIMNAAGPAGWVASGIQAAAILASGIASIASIKSKDLSGLDKAEKMLPNEQEFLTMTPVRTITGYSEMDEINKPVKVYVTEKDITNAQNKVKVKESETTW